MDAAPAIEPGSLITRIWKLPCDASLYVNNFCKLVPKQDFE